MKKAFILFLFVVSSMCLVAQTTEPIFSKKSSWIEVFADCGTFDIFTYKIEGDTVINDNIYSKLFLNNEYFSALRETEDHKVYVCFSDDYSETRDFLVYDFDWQPNDTLYHDNMRCDSIIHVILNNEIDSMQLLNGKYYQYANGYRGEFADCWHHVGDTIIKGIGDTRGFFYSISDISTCGSHDLLCFYINDMLVYSNPKYNYCNTNSITINSAIDTNVQIIVYPNPSNDVVIVEFPENVNIETFTIFDTKGSVIKTYDVKGKRTIEIQNLAKGVYIYSAITENYRKLSGTIIIK